MAKKIWKKKIIKKTYESETGTRDFEKVIWVKDKQAERNERWKESKERKRRAKKIPLVEKPMSKNSPRIILRKRKKDPSETSVTNVEA